jgi:hypothetical protein
MGLESLPDTSTSSELVEKLLEATVIEGMVHIEGAVGGHGGKQVLIRHEIAAEKVAEEVEIPSKGIIQIDLGLVGLRIDIVATACNPEISRVFPCERKPRVPRISPLSIASALRIQPLRSSRSKVLCGMSASS